MQGNEMGTDKRRWPRRAGLLLGGLVAVVLVGYLALIVIFRAVTPFAWLASS